MPREIKFKAWDKFKRKWFRTGNPNAKDAEVSDLTMHANVLYLMSSVPEPHNDEQYDFLQFTGLKDKNGKDVYEGYVVKEQNIGETYEVRYEAPYLGGYKDGCLYTWECLHEPEVIGNIYENPELLK